MICYGYRYDSNGEHSPVVRLEDQDAVIRYIRENLESPQLFITDDHDRQLLLLQDGVDLFNELDWIGVPLPALYEQIRMVTIGESPPSPEKPEWERLYDQVGLSPGEIRMRQRVKAACRAVRTVADVAEVVRGTYFDAHFLSKDEQKWYRFFDEDDFSATLMTIDENGNWMDDPEKAILSPTIQVRHLRSSEDSHTLELLSY